MENKYKENRNFSVKVSVAFCSLRRVVKFNSG